MSSLRTWMRILNGQLCDRLREHALKKPIKYMEDCLFISLVIKEIVLHVFLD